MDGVAFAKVSELNQKTLDTKARVVDAATRLFASRGLEHVSIRELTNEAGVNLAAVNYHFGSKEILYEAVLENISDRVNEKRLLNLHKVLSDADAAGSRPSMAAILDTFMEPYLDPHANPDGAVLVQLILKDRLSQNAMTARIIQRHFNPLARSYVEAFVKACPDVPREHFYWRYTFMYGAIILTVSDRASKDNRLSTMSLGQIDGTDTAALSAALIDFLVPALSAPGSRSCGAAPA